MRKIKFQVWSKALQSMFWFDVTWGSSWGMGGGWLPCVPWGKERAYHPSNIIAIDPQEAELMQFTGLHDKNGREIYEGDILRSTAWGTTVAIKWSEQTAGWKLYNQDGQDAPAYPEWLTTMYEVIGNIYEDPIQAPTPSQGESITKEDQ